MNQRRTNSRSHSEENESSNSKTGDRDLSRHRSVANLSITLWAGFIDIRSRGREGKFHDRLHIFSAVLSDTSRYYQGVDIQLETLPAVRRAS